MADNWYSTCETEVKEAITASLDPLPEPEPEPDPTPPPLDNSIYNFNAILARSTHD